MNAEKTIEDITALAKRYVSVLSSQPVQILFEKEGFYVKAIISIEDSLGEMWMTLTTFSATNLEELYEAIDIALYEELYGEDEFYKPFQPVQVRAKVIPEEDIENLWD
jgi:hypothetical protein